MKPIKKNGVIYLQETTETELNLEKKSEYLQMLKTDLEEVNKRYEAISKDKERLEKEIEKVTDIIDKVSKL